MAECERKRRRNQTKSPDKQDKENSPAEKQDSEKCITCKELVTDSDIIECQWCQKWEHKVCAKLSDNDFILLGRTSDRIRFSCSLCAPRVDVVLKFFDSFYEKQICIDARLQGIETQLAELSGLQRAQVPALSKQSNSEKM